MPDLTHDHLSFGFHDGCQACEQTLNDLESALTDYWLTPRVRQARRAGRRGFLS